MSNPKLIIQLKDLKQIIHNIKNIDKISKKNIIKSIKEKSIIAEEQENISIPAEQTKNMILDSSLKIRESKIRHIESEYDSEYDSDYDSDINIDERIYGNKYKKIVISGREDYKYVFGKLSFAEVKSEQGEVCEYIAKYCNNKNCKKIHGISNDVFCKKIQIIDISNKRTVKGKCSCVNRIDSFKACSGIITQRKCRCNKYCAMVKMQNLQNEQNVKDNIPICKHLHF